MDTSTLSASLMSPWRHSQVWAEQWVASKTMSFGVAASVLGLGDNFHVCGVHTKLVSAQVIDLQADGDATNDKFVGDPVGEVGAPAPLVFDAPIGVSIPSPVPASGGLVDLRPEPFDKLCVHAEPPFSVPSGRANHRRGPTILL